jgi:allophanate hydrolase subunit 1
MKTPIDKAESWSKSIITWALLGIAAAQFMDLRDTVKDMHKMVIKHDNQLDNHKEEIDRLREIERPQISQKR